MWSGKPKSSTSMKSCHSPHPHTQWRRTKTEDTTVVPHTRWRHCCLCCSKESRQLDSEIKRGRRARGIIKNAAVLNLSGGRPLIYWNVQKKKEKKEREERRKGREMKQRVFFFFLRVCSSDILNRLCAKDEGDPRSFINM